MPWYAPLLLLAAWAPFCLAPAAAGSGDDKSAVRKALVGKQSPDLEADFALHTKARRLADFKGKVVVLDFWAVWCNPCFGAFPNLKKWHADFQMQDVEVVGVTFYNSEFGKHWAFDRLTGKTKEVAQTTVSAERDLLKEFAEHHKIQYPLLVLPRAEAERVLMSYGIDAIPMVVLIDKNGKVRSVHGGAHFQNAETIEAEIKALVNER